MLKKKACNICLTAIHLREKKKSEQIIMISTAFYSGIMPKTFTEKCLCMQDS